jgi:uncharacterized protein (DUF58 family)
VRPTRRGIALAALGLLPALLPLVTGSGVLWLPWLGYWGLLLALGLVDALRCPQEGDLEVHLAAPREVLLGVPGKARLTLVLQSPRSLPAEGVLDLDDLWEPLPRFHRELSRTPVEMEVPLCARRRGRGVIEALAVRWSGPLGLVERTAARALGVEVRAVPNVGFVRGPGLAFARDRQAPVGLKIEQYAGDGSEFSSLREWLPGLDRRALDWKASARHTRLLAREFRAERNHQVILAVDTGRLMAEPVADLPLLDHALHAALLLAYVALSQGDRVGFFPFAAQPGAFVPPRAGVQSMGALVHTAGGLAYRYEETNFTLALTTLGERLRRRSLVVVLTDFVDQVTAELMVDNLARLSRRHLVLFVAVSDPELARVFDHEPATLLDLDRAVVAGALLDERRGTLARLRELGIFAIDAPPEQVQAPLLNRYLEIKRQELLG